MPEEEEVAPPPRRRTRPGHARAGGRYRTGEQCRRPQHSSPRLLKGLGRRHRALAAAGGHNLPCLALSVDGGGADARWPAPLRVGRGGWPQPSSPRPLNGPCLPLPAHVDGEPAPCVSRGARPLPPTPRQSCSRRCALVAALGRCHGRGSATRVDHGTRLQPPAPRPLRRTGGRRRSAFSPSLATRRALPRQILTTCS